MDQPLLQIGQTSITLAQVLTSAAVFALLLLIATAVFAWRKP